MHRRSRWLVVAAGAGVAGGAIATACSLTHSAEDDIRGIDSESIVMLGDSITDQAVWSELLPAWPVVNAGRSGYTTAQLVPVAAAIASREPAMVFVLTGTNDIRDGYPPEWTATQLASLLDAIESESPSTTIVVQTILPRSDRPDEAGATAGAIEAAATSLGVRVLDLYSPFNDGSGGLRSDETTDGIHLSSAGYQRWATLLITELRRP